MTRYDQLVEIELGSSIGRQGKFLGHEILLVYQINQLLDFLLADDDPWFPDLLGFGIACECRDRGHRACVIVK